MNFCNFLSDHTERVIDPQVSNSDVGRVEYSVLAHAFVKGLSTTLQRISGFQVEINLIIKISKDFLQLNEYKYES